MDLTLERILEELKKQKLKQKQLAEFLGLKENAVGNWKAGLNQSYLKYLHAIAEFLGVSVEYLKGETDQKEKPPIEGDERLKELYELTKGLSDSEYVAFKAFVAGLKASRPQD